MTHDPFASAHDPLWAWELTVNDPSQIVLDGNAAFERIREHKRLFRRDWLPFIDGVYLVSLQALERARTISNSGTTTTVDGKPDWTNPLIQAAFRELTQNMPWRDYFVPKHRRPLLSIIRKIGAERDAFLAWYDALEEEDREQLGHPQTLWRKYEACVKDKAEQAAEGKEEPNALAERIDDLVNAESDDITETEQCEPIVERRRIAFLQALRESIDGGNTMLEPGIAMQFQQVWADLNNESLAGAEAIDHAVE